MVEQFTLCRVFLLAIHFEASLDVVEQRLFCGIVGCAEMSGALKHQVLEIVCKTRCLGWVVAASGAHCDIGLYAWLLLVYSEIDLHTVVEGVDS